VIYWGRLKEYWQVLAASSTDLVTELQRQVAINRSYFSNEEFSQLSTILAKMGEIATAVATLRRAFDEILSRIQERRQQEQDAPTSDRWSTKPR